MKTYMTRLFTVLMLAMFSMGAWADVKIFYGEKGEELKNGETKIKADNGTIAIEQKASSDGSQTTVNLTFTPNSGYTISTDNIEVYAVISPNSGSTRAPEISGDPLKLSEESSKDPEKRYSVKVDSKLGLWIKKASFLSGSKNNRNTTYTYYALHCNNKGYLKQYKGIVGNDGTFRYENAYDDNGSSMWVYSSDGYLQQEMYYLNVLNGQTLVLSTTPETKWDLVDDNEKKRFQLNGSTKILGLDASNKVTLAESPTNKYAACTLTVTENNSKWDGPKDVSWTVQSPQLVTYLRTYYLRNITVNIDKNDAGTENVKVVDKKDSRCYCTLTYKSTSNTDKGTKWDINTTTGIVYNMTTSQVKNVAATYEVAPLNPIVLADHAASDQTITLTINAKALSPDDSKKYLLFSTQDGNYRFPKASSSISEGDLLPVNGKQSDLTEAVNGEISYEIEVDDEGFCSFKNLTTSRYLYYDAADFTVSNYGAVKIGSTSIGSDTRYKFRLYSAGKRDPFESCLYIIPYDKQFAVWKSDGVLAELYFALYMNTSGNTKIASIYKASDNAKWKIYAYEWEYRLWDNWSISGDQSLYATGNHFYTASTWFSRNIKGSPTNAEHLMLPNSKTHNGITYTWTLTGFNDYISTSNELASGTSTMTASVNSLPPGTRTGTLTVKASISSPASKNNSKSIPINLHNLNPTLTEISKLSEITDANGLYKLTANNVYSSENKPVEDFSGTLDGGGFTISGLTAPLFTTLDGGTVRNLNLDNISINSGDGDGNTGAIACVAKEAARIYNVGILSGSVGGTGYTGGLIGQLNGSARVINCFSYANITGGTEVGGIVGYNNYESKANDIRTMVMNCMFYGDITGGTTVSPVYGGKNINNLQGGLNTFNYYSYDKATNFNNFSEGDNKKYNCALAVEEKYLNRFEYYRLLLNSNKKLAAFYVTGSADNAGQMAKWVLETADRTIESPKPYPVLKAQGYYPSIVNIDADNAPSLTLKDGKPKEEDRKKGGKLGTLSVTIRTKSEKTDGGQSWPSTADVQTTSLPLVVRTDMDEDRFNFNYDKIQLPYYNDVGTGNYTENRVVTGWKITDITTLADDPYTEDNYDYSKTYAANQAYFDYPNYNFADRKSSNKDKYSISGRVFSQGAYFDVPYGVTSITIEPYWAKAAYIADPNYDAVYDTGYSKQNVPQTGTQVGNSTMFDGEKLGTTGQVVKTSISDALTYIKDKLGGYGSKVYDNAVVLVGNFHQAAIPSNGTNPFTIMSVDTDKDNEPDYSMTYHHTGKLKVCPIRFDFLNIPGAAQAQKPNGADKICNMAIIHPSAWFEITNTSSIYFSQLEYEDKVDNENKTEGPLILQGGIIDQIVSANKNPHNGKTIYVHVGGNVWFKEFNIGIHGDGSNATAHVPVSVTGGDYESFYLTGIYNQDASVKTDNAECYISGGHFKEVAGAGQEAINGSVRWQIYDADIDNFFGGGTNGATGKNIKGDVTVDIFNSHVTTFCGGPKFGNMESGKKVTTTADGCVFGKYFGAGYGGTAYSRKKYYDQTNTQWTTWEGKFTTDRGNYFDGSKASGNALGTNGSYGYKGIGVATDFDYEFFVWSSGDTGGRFYVKFASFSLAQCNEVKSELTNCTINENFYGGGKLGKVAGTVTSVLDGCTVKGNVFGAGFSASKDPVSVRDAGFGTKKPNYNKKSGMFEPADWSGTTSFTWKHVDSYPSNGGVGFDLTNSNDPKVITTVDLSESNLGSVAGNVTLTLKGNTTVGTMVTTVDEETEESVTTLTSGTGNVFGGGESSYVTGASNKVTVNIEGNTHVYGNVFGGGDEGVVEGSTEVNIMYTKPTPTPEP